MKNLKYLTTELIAVLILFSASTFISGSLYGQETKELTGGKTCYQSSTSHGGAASRAIDGVRDGNWSNNSVTHTTKEQNPWWEVDLGENYEITSIRVHNRTDCCAERLSSVQVHVYERKGTTGTILRNAYDRGTYYEFSGQATGRYVRVMLTDHEYLSIAEVDVYGYEAEEETEAYGSNGIIDARPQTVYMDVCTGNDGTDADVYANVYFHNGRSTRILLDKPSYDDFEQGDQDKYNLGFTVTNGLSEIKGFTLELQDGDDWYVIGASLTTDSQKISCRRNLEMELEEGTSTVLTR